MPKVDRGNEVITLLEPTEGMRSLSNHAQEKAQEKILEKTYLSGKQEGNFYYCESALHLSFFFLPHLHLPFILLQKEYIE